MDDGRRLAGVEAPGQADFATRELPANTPIWFEYLVLGGCSSLLCFGGFGLLLAVISQFTVWRVLPVGVVGAVACIVLGRPRQSGRRAATFRSSTLPALGMCVSAGGVALWSAIYSAHHVAVDSDPGVYEVAGRWLADHKSLVVPAGTPWNKTGLNLAFGSGGMYPHTGGTVEFQFAHLLPVLLAEAYKLGSAGLMFRLTAVVGALGLCAVYLVGCRIIHRPWLVLAAVTALGVSLPELYVSRDTFTEPVSQALLWSGIWLLMRAYEERRIWVALIAGMAIGGTLMVHIDAVIYLVPLPLLGAVSWLAAKSSPDRRALLRLFAGVLVGLVPLAVLGTFDVQRRAGTYYDDLHTQMHSLYGALVLMTIVAVAVVVVWPRSERIRSRLVSGRARIGVVVGWLVAGGLLWAWSLRPAGPKATGSSAIPAIAAYQMAENELVQANRTYAEQTLRWIEWYIGPIALALAIAGLCLLTVLIIRRGSAPALVVVAMTAPLTAIYLWNPSITPDQVWAMRRYVPVSLPLFALAAAVALDSVAALCARRFREPAWQRGILAAGAAGLIAFPLGTSLPIGRFQPQANYLPAITKTCRAIGSNAAVIFPLGDIDGSYLTQTLRSWCNVPAAGFAGRVTPGQLQSAAATLGREGRTLWILGRSPQSIDAAVPGVSPQLIAAASSPHEIQGTVSKPVSRYLTVRVAIYGARISP